MAALFAGLGDRNPRIHAERSVFQFDQSPRFRGDI